MLEGMQDILADVQRIKKAGPDSGIQTAREKAEELLPIAQERAPKKTGRMARTGRVRKTKRGADVTFGDKDVRYAAYQHEHVGLKHEQGGAKFLEQPMAERADGYLKACQENLNKALGDA